MQDVEDGLTIETDRLRAMFDDRGSLVSLKLIPNGPELIAGPANVVAQEPDHGDLWEPYRPLDGGSRIAMKDRHPVSPDATLTSQTPDNRVTALRGPVYSEVHVEGALGQGRFASTVRLIEGLTRVDIHTTILNNDRFVRCRALFPTTIAEGRRFDEIPFGAIERPDGIEYPAQNWVDWSGPSGGLAVLNRGLPGANVADGILMLSLLRSTCIVAYGFGGGYEPGMSSETGFELGKTRAFDYALLPHGGDRRQASLHRRGMEFNHPLIVRKTTCHAGRLRPRQCLMEPLDPCLGFTSLRPSADGGIILRLYEATGRNVESIPLRLAVPMSAAWEVDLMDENERPLPVADGQVQLSLRAWEVKTIKVRG